MKRYLIALGAMLAATLSLTNCTEEFQTGPDSVKTSYTIYADAADTKTANDGFSTKWSKGDSLNVFHAESGSAWKSNNIPFGIADVETGEFTSDSFDGNLAEVNDWYVIYPYNNKIISPSELDEVGYLAMGARVGSSQVQKGNDSMAHIGGKSYPMYGIAKGVAGSEFPHIMMTHLTSLIEVVVTNSSDTPITVNSVTFDAPENITGTYYVGIDEEEPSFLSSGDAYVSDVVRLAVKEAEPIETGASAKFYFAIKPFTAPAGETLTLTVNNVVKTFELDKDVVFSSGKVKTLNFNIDEYYALDPGPYTSNMVWTLGEKAYTEKGIINDVEDVKVLKIGTGSVYSSASVMVPAGTSKIGFYAVSWNGNAATLALKKGEEVIGEVYPPVNEGASNTSPYTIYENDEACYFEITVNAEEDAEYSFVPSGKPRVIIWGVNYYTAEGDLGEDQAPVEQEVVDATIPEFLAAEVSSDVLYRVSGTIASIEEISEKYNNATLTIEDADANALYIFRMKPSGEENIADLGLNVGDELTVVGCRGDYEGNPQMVNGYYESHIDGEVQEPEPEPELVPGPYTSNMVWTLGEKAYSQEATVNDEADVPVLKLGTSSVAGSATITVPAGTTKIGFYAVAWNKSSAEIELKLGEEVIGTAAVSGNEGASNDSPYTINVEDASAYYEIAINAVEEAEYTITTNGKKRVIIWGLNYYTEDGIGEDQGSTEPEPEPEPDQPEIPADPADIANGNYWIIANGKVATPLTEDKSYGYLNVEDAVDGASTAANAFTFTKADDGSYMIQDSFGRYVYQTDNYNSFNVSTELGNDNGYYWTISMSGDAYVIMNNAVSKFIQYDTNYNSYGSYVDARGVLPVLVLADNPIEEEPEPEPEEPGQGAGTDGFEPNITWTLGTNAYDNTNTGNNCQTGVVNDVEVSNILKLGTGSKVGNATLHVPEGTTKLGFYCVAWKGKKAQLKFSIGGEEIATVEPAANVGATGNAPYTITVADSDYYEVEMPSTDAADVQVETLDPSNGRVLIIGLQALTD